MNAPRAIAIALLFAACGDPASSGAAPAARRPTASDLHPDNVVAAILDACHRPLMQRMQNVKVRVTLAGGRELRVQAVLPDRVRVQDGRSKFLLRDGRVMRIDDGELTDDRRDEVRALAVLVDAVAFGPLHRNAATQLGDDGYRLADGSIVRLRPDSLLPMSLTIGEHTVRFDDYLRTPASSVVSRATMPGLGTCEVYFEDGGVRFAPTLFDPPGDERASKPRIRMAAPGANIEAAHATPTIEKVQATDWLVVPDEGGWRERHVAYLPLHAELTEQNQFVAGFPMLFEERGRSWLAAPFQRRKRGDAFVAPRGWTVRKEPAGRALVVYPTDGTVEQRIVAGRRQLQRALRIRGLTASGPIVAQPFVHLHQGEPGAEKLASAKVRVSVRVE